MRTALKKWAPVALVVCLALVPWVCRRNPSPEQLNRKLLSAFESAGYFCTWEALPQNAPVGLYKASAWKALQVNGETVLVYFDESNRADYLATLIDGATFGYATHFGQRFVLTYAGHDEKLLALLQSEAFA